MPGRATWTILLACVLAFAALRFVHIEADPPNWINLCFTRELYAEPPAKAHEARNFALFGKWHLNATDNYQFWRAQSPVWVYPLTWVFMTFGTDYFQLRAFSVLYATFGTLMLLLIAAQRLRPSSVLFVGAVLVFDRVYFHYTRVGLVEPAVSAWLALSLFALIRAHRHAAWLVLAHAAFVLAFFTKQAAAFAAPILAYESLLVLTAKAPDAAQRRARIVAVACAVLLAGASLAYMSTESYLRAVHYNAGHLFVGTDAPNDLRWKGVESLLVRLLDVEHYWHAVVALRLPGPLALFVIGVWTHASLRQRRPFEPFQRITTAWFLLSFLAMMAIAKSELRFWTLVVPPAVLLSGAGIDVLAGYLERYRGKRWMPWVQRGLVPTALVILFAINVRGMIKAFDNPKYTLRDAAARLRDHLGDRDVTIVGVPSPQLLLGTPYRNYYVRADFNSTRASLKRLGINYLLFQKRGDVSRQIFEREFPGLGRFLQPELELEFRGVKHLLYPVRDRLVRYPDR